MIQTENTIDKNGDYKKRINKTNGTSAYAPEIVVMTWHLPYKLYSESIIITIMTLYDIVKRDMIFKKYWGK